MQRLLVALAASLALTASLPAQGQGLPKEQQVLVMIGSYLGIASFCKAYGVDFTDVADKVDNGIRRNILPKEDAGHTISYTMGHKAGSTGSLYSPQAGDFVDLVKSGADMKQACSAAHQQVIKISKMK